MPIALAFVPSRGSTSSLQGLTAAFMPRIGAIRRCCLPHSMVFCSVCFFTEVRPCGELEMQSRSTCTWSARWVAQVRHCGISRHLARFLLGWRCCSSYLCVWTWITVAFEDRLTQINPANLSTWKRYATFSGLRKFKVGFLIESYRTRLSLDTSGELRLWKSGLRLFTL